MLVSAYAWLVWRLLAIKARPPDVPQNSRPLNSFALYLGLKLNVDCRTIPQPFGLAERFARARPIKRMSNMTVSPLLLLVEWSIARALAAPLLGVVPVTFSASAGWSRSLCPMATTATCAHGGWSRPQEATKNCWTKSS